MPKHSKLATRLQASGAIDLCRGSFAVLLSCMFLLSPTPTPARAADGFQSCTGVLERDGDGLLALKPDQGLKSLWCDASIGDTPESELAKEVLKACSLGERCKIEGDFVGHGVFYWQKIVRVMSLSTLRAEKPEAVREAQLDRYYPDELQSIITQCWKGSNGRDVIEAKDAAACMSVQENDYGKKLQTAYDNLIGRLGPSPKALLVESERAWLMYQKTFCAYRGQNSITEYKMLSGASCLLETSYHRYDELRVELERLEGNAP